MYRKKIVILQSKYQKTKVRYNAYSDYFRRRFGTRVQKLSIDAGFSCPNRDGRVATGGCTFCTNEAFSPSYLRRVPTITAQLDEGIAFHRRRYRSAAVYLAYFQSYSNTYAPVEVLRERYDEALRHPGVVGLVVGTRPDCVDGPVLDLLADYAKEHYVAVEYGIESCHDRTLRLVNRGHDFACTEAAIRATARRGLPVGGHLILGLPGESREDLLAEAAILNRLPLTTVKFHQLQILKGTAMERQYRDEAFRRSLLQFSLEEYISLLCDLLERLRPDLVVERLAGEVPPRFQACPERSFRRADGHLLRNEEIPALVEAELERRDSRQGALYKPKSQTLETTI